MRLRDRSLGGARSRGDTERARERVEATGASTRVGIGLDAGEAVPTAGGSRPCAERSCSVVHSHEVRILAADRAHLRGG